MNHTCASCFAPAKLRCGRCKACWYCTQTCQREHWKTHNTSCKPSTAQRRTLIDIRQYARHKISDDNHYLPLEVCEMILDYVQSPRDVISCSLASWCWLQSSAPVVAKRRISVRAKNFEFPFHSFMPGGPLSYRPITLDLTDYQFGAVSRPLETLSTLLATGIKLISLCLCGSPYVELGAKYLFNVLQQVPNVVEAFTFSATRGMKWEEIDDLAKIVEFPQLKYLAILDASFSAADISWHYITAINAFSKMLSGCKNIQVFGFHCQNYLRFDWLKKNKTTKVVVLLETPFNEVQLDEDLQDRATFVRTKEEFWSHFPIYM